MPDNLGRHVHINIKKVLKLMSYIQVAVVQRVSRHRQCTDRDAITRQCLTDKSRRLKTTFPWAQSPEWYFLDLIPL